MSARARLNRDGLFRVTGYVGSGNVIGESSAASVEEAAGLAREALSSGRSRFVLVEFHGQREAFLVAMLGPSARIVTDARFAAAYDGGEVTE